MKKKKNNDVEQANLIMKKQIEQKFKKPIWERFIDSLGTFLSVLLIALPILVLIIGVVVVIITLIENPLSLAILIVGILLVVMWGSR